jgi:hypothetical protein
MISRQDATRHISKYRQVQSDIGRIIADMDRYDDHIIYCAGGPGNAFDYLCLAEEALEETIRNLSHEEEYE